MLHPELPREASQARYNDGRQALQGKADDIGVDLKPGVVTPLEDYRTVMLQRGIFQAIASMGLPAFTIHSLVRYSGRALKDVKNVKLRTYGPIGLGLAAVPMLPYMFDEPVEKAVEWVFHTGFETIGGKEAVGASRVTGREAELEARNKRIVVKEKEL